MVINIDKKNRIHIHNDGYVLATYKRGEWVEGEKFKTLDSAICAIAPGLNDDLVGRLKQLVEVGT